MPLDPKLTKYTTASPILASYNYDDVAEGTKGIVYYGVRLETSAGATLGLTTRTTSSAGVSGDWQLSGIAAGTTHTFNSAPFTRPKTIGGNAFVSGTLTSNAGNNIKIKVIFYKVSTATTAISSEIESQAVGASTEEAHFAVPLTNTRFSKGDILRITVEVVGVNGAQYITANPAETSINPIRFEVPDVIII